MKNLHLQYVYSKLKLSLSFLVRCSSNTWSQNTFSVALTSFPILPFDVLIILENAAEQFRDRAWKAQNVQIFVIKKQ